MPVQADDRTRRRIVKALTRQMVAPHDEGGQVLAYVNLGRWVADCPCGGAELVGAEPMICGSCGTVSEVIWPDNYNQLERLLQVRPPNNQNWTPGEPETQLEEENIMHGLRGR